MSFRALGVTCGIGSMLIGAKQAGFEIAGNIEWRGYCHTGTFEHNFPNAFIVKKYDDLTEEQKKDIQGIDLVMGHPDCGNYSKMTQNKNLRGNPGDIPLFVSLIKKVNPKIFVMDNLPKCLIAYTIKQWHRELSNYDLFPELVCNAAYGNSQKHRNRFFMVGAKKNQKFIFLPTEIEDIPSIDKCFVNLPYERDIPEINHEHRSLDEQSDYISYKKDRRKLTYKEVSRIFLDIPKVLEELKEENISEQRLRKLGFRRNLSNSRVWNPPYRTKEGEIRLRIGKCKLNWGDQAFLVTGGENLYHPETAMPLTCRERARIQGCPDNFYFVLPKKHGSKMWKQTGKFMPVQFCRYISGQIMIHLMGLDFKSSGERLIKSNRYIDDAKKWYCQNIGYGGIQNKVCEACWLSCKEGFKDENI